jgi:hypothetical protein
MPFQTGPGPTQLPTQWIKGSFLGVKWPKRDVNHPLLSRSQIKILALYHYSPSQPNVAHSKVNVTFVLRYFVTFYTPITPSPSTFINSQ